MKLRLFEFTAQIKEDDVPVAKIEYRDGFPSDAAHMLREKIFPRVKVTSLSAEVMLAAME